MITEERKEQMKKYYQENKEKIRKNQNKKYKKFYDENKERLLSEKKIKRRTEIYKEKKRIYERTYEKNRKKNDLLYNISKKIKSKISKSLKNNGYTKKSKTNEILGCSYEEFKQHLESKFEPWMIWDNYGKYKIDTFNYGWDIDHIIPQSSAMTEEELLKLNHYTNLQPLCSKINRDIKKNGVILK